MAKCLRCGATEEWLQGAIPYRNVRKCGTQRRLTKVWCVWIDNGSHYEPMLYAVYARAADARKEARGLDATVRSHEIHYPKEPKR